jgi:transaldolase
LFGLDRYKQVAHAYINGLKIRLEQGKPIHRIASVASFFLSRIDVLIDPLLEKIMNEKNDQSSTAKALQGQIAIASANLAYEIYKDIFSDKQFESLAAKGARTQRLLWASTSTKNPNYSDVKYVEALICPQTVNTLPLETLKAYRDHGHPEVRLGLNFDQSKKFFDCLSSLGIDIDKVTEQLEKEGVIKFNESYDKLIATLKTATQQD